MILSQLSDLLWCGENTLEIAIITPDLEILGEIMTQTPITFVRLDKNQYFTFSALTTRFTDFFFPTFTHSQGRNCLPLNGLGTCLHIINSISSSPFKTKQHLRRDKLNPYYKISERSEAFLLYIILVN